MNRDRIHHYLEVFDGLRRARRWSANTAVLRFAAMTLATLDDPDPIPRLEETVRALKENTKWTSPLRSPVRFSIAAMILRREIDPRIVIERMEEVRAEFRSRRLRRGGTYEVLAALLLVLNARGARVAPHLVQRTGDILKRWEKDHRFLTGADDYPMAALHATGDLAIEQIGRSVEEIYQALRKRKYTRGNQLQLASHLLAVSQRYPEEIARRFAALGDAFREARSRIGTAQYDEAALLSLTAADPERVVREVLTVRNELMQHKPKPVKSIAFSLATGLYISEAAQEDESLREGADLAAIRSAQAILEAQQAAMVAVIGASAATTAATS